MLVIHTGNIDMRSKKWTRDDVVSWLNECECEEESYSVHSNDIAAFPYNSENLSNHVNRMNGIDNAACPETYQKVANTICQDPYTAIEAIRPIMKQIGVGCPQSFAKALVDVLTAGQDMGIIKPFNTDKI